MRCGTNSGKAADCLEIFPLGGPKGNQTVLRDVTLKDSLIIQKTFRGKFFPDKPKAFPLFVRL